MPSVQTRSLGEALRSAKVNVLQLGHFFVVAVLLTSVCKQAFVVLDVVSSIV